MKPPVLTMRTLKRFAILPVEMDNGDWIWLKKYDCLQVFGYKILEIGHYMAHWKYTRNRWLNVSKYLNIMYVIIYLGQQWLCENVHGSVNLIVRLS